MDGSLEGLREEVFQRLEGRVGPDLSRQGVPSQEGEIRRRVLKYKLFARGRGMVLLCLEG